MASILLSETVNNSSQVLLVRSTSGSSIIPVNFQSIRQLTNATEWAPLVDMEDAEELRDTEKMVLLDCTESPLLNSLTSLSKDNLVLAVLCVCREVTDQELKLSPEELSSGKYPLILFVQDKATEVDELKQLLLLNPQEVECCCITPGQSPTRMFPQEHLSLSVEYTANKGLGAQLGVVDLETGDTFIHDTLDSLFFKKKQEDDKVPLTLCRHPQTISAIINFIYQIVYSHAPNKKDSYRNSLNQFINYLRSKVIFHSHVHADWPIYMVIFLEIIQIFDNPKENQANEAIEYITDNFLKLNPEVIAYSIERFGELFEDKILKFRKLYNPKNILVELFSTQYARSQKSGNKSNRNKYISKQEDLENKLLWYNVVMLCKQCFKSQVRSKWREDLINQLVFDQLSIYDLYIINTIMESGIQFGIKLGLSFDNRFLLGHIADWVSCDIRNYTFQKFNTLLTSIMNYKYEMVEITDFLNCYSNFISQYSKLTSNLTSLLGNNPEIRVETLSKLATLICTTTRDCESTYSEFQVCKKIWFDIYEIFLSHINNYYILNHSMEGNLVVSLRCFYDIKIPTAPEPLVKPWIKEQKKEVVVLITNLSNRVNIVTFYEILTKFPVVVLSKVTIFDYFTQYQPPSMTNLKDHIWQNILSIIFKMKDPPKSIFHTLERIFDDYLQRNIGIDFICNCLEFDLPAYGLEYKLTEDKSTYNFISAVESKCKNELRFVVNRNLASILDFIPKLRLPSLLQAVIMGCLCRAIVPEQSLLSKPNEDWNCRTLLISLEALSCQKSITTTCELIASSYQHYYLWRILSSITEPLKFCKLVWSKFPPILITLMRTFANFRGVIPGFQENLWEDKNLLSYIGFCKKSYNIISGNYNDLLNDECSLTEYATIQRNLESLNQLFESSGLAILYEQEIQTKIDAFSAIAKEMNLTLFLELKVEKTEIKYISLLEFLKDFHAEAPAGVMEEIDALLILTLFNEQSFAKDKNKKYVARDTLKLREFKLRSQQLGCSFKKLSNPISEGSQYSVRQFLAHFRIRENVLFDACLRKCIADKMQEIRREGDERDKHYISTDQFVECTVECYHSLKRICEGNSTYTEVEHISEYLCGKSLDFTQIYTDFKTFPPLAGRINSDPKIPDNMNIITSNINTTNVICTRINVLCKEYDPQAFLENTAMHSSQHTVRPTVPNNLYEALQFLNLLSRMQQPLIILTIAGFILVKNVLKIYLEIFHSLSFEKSGFLIRNIPISFELINSQHKFNKFIHKIPIDVSTDPNFSLFTASCALMKASVHSIVQLFNSRQLTRSQLLTLREELNLYNNILDLLGEVEPIAFEVLSSQISQYEEKQREIKQLLYFNPDICTVGNSLLNVMKKYSVYFPATFDEHVTSVLSSFDSSTVHSDAVEITLEQLITKCTYIQEELCMLSRDVFDFISFFTTNDNFLFLSLLGQITSQKLNELSSPSDRHLDIKQFVQCAHETYQQMHSMCIGDYTYTQVPLLFTHPSCSSQNTDLKNLVDNLSEFPKFSLILKDGFPSLCLFELQLVSHYIPFIVDLCENFNLQVCINSFDYQSLQKHSHNLRDIKYCERINIPLANQLMRDINRLLPSMSLDRLELLATISKCNSILLFFNELNLKNGRDELEKLLTKILSDPKLEKCNLSISNNLLSVYDCLAPLFDKKLNFSELINLYSNLPMDNEQTAAKLEQFKSNINEVRVCFECVYES